MAIELDIKVTSKGLDTVFAYVQSTNAIPIIFRITDFEIESGSTASLYIKKPSGLEVVGSAEIDGNNVTVEPTTQMFAEKGYNRGQIEIINGDSVLCSFPFTVLVIENLTSDSAVESSNEYTALQGIIQEAQEAISDTENAISSANAAASNANSAAGQIDSKVNAAVDSAIQDILLRFWPVGSIYESTNNTNPSTLFGGTWEEFGKGQVLVGYDSSQTEFNSVPKTGGAKTVTLTEAQIPNIHGQIEARAGSGGTSDGGYGAFRAASGDFSVSDIHQYGQPGDPALFAGSGNGYGIVTLDFGSGGSHNNLQPYITVYRWRRTA